jgi:hypothetical protein
MRVLLIVMLILASLHAERSGPYIGVGIGAGFYDSDKRLREPESKTEEGSYRLTLGAYISEHFSVELDYTLYKKFYGVYEGGDVKESFSGISITALPHWPFYHDTFDLYGKIGAGQIFWDESGARSNSDASGSYIAGIGIGYRLQKRYLFKLGYDLTSFGLDDSHTHKSYSMRLDYIYTAFEVKF